MPATRSAIRDRLLGNFLSTYGEKAWTRTREMNLPVKIDAALQVKETRVT